MIATKTSEAIDPDRRRFFRAAALTIAAAEFGTIGTEQAQAGAATTKPGANSAFAPLKQIDAGVLNVGYAEAGPAEGPAVMLLHGGPYDIYSYADVAPALAPAGYSYEHRLVKGGVGHNLPQEAQTFVEAIVDVAQS